MHAVRRSSRSRRRSVPARLLACGVAALVAAAGVGALGAVGGGGHATTAGSSGSAAGSGQVLDGSIQAKLAALRGVPVVVNQWASWCENCRQEFPFFQQLARAYAHRVAFVGLDSQDARGDAEGFLRQFPVPYPSIFDPGADQARSLGGGRGWPTTFFYDRSGRQTYVREGAYPQAAALAADIRRYALGLGT